MGLHISCQTSHADKWGLCEEYGGPDLSEKEFQFFHPL